MRVKPRLFRRFGSWVCADTLGMAFGATPLKAWEAWSYWRTDLRSPLWI